MLSFTSKQLPGSLNASHDTNKQKIRGLPKNLDIQRIDKHYKEMSIIHSENNAMNEEDDSYNSSDHQIV